MAEEEKIEQHIIADRTLIRTARIISGILTPFSIPFLAFLVLFLFSYLRIMPLQYKLIVLGIVYCFTILMQMTSTTSDASIMPVMYQGMFSLCIIIRQNTYEMMVSRIGT